jgi:hypothetical protein
MHNPLLDTRIALFYGYYIDILYTENEETFIEALKMLVNSINTKNLALAH